jgi:hypothetical protein
VPVEVPLPWERLLWSGRSAWLPRLDYRLTDLRLVVLSRPNGEEVALYDIADVTRHQTPVDRLLGTSTLIVHRRSTRQPPLVLLHVRRGAQLAALLDLLSGDPSAAAQTHALDAALSWEPRGDALGYRDALAGTAAVIAALCVILLGFHRTSAAIVYPPDDAIVPSGAKRPRPEIVRFMETAVMPWARQVLGPLKGGAHRVTCETCHGADAHARGWQMPAVAALPEPIVRERGWELHGGAMDAQLRNAIYGYIAGSDKQTTAAYMRELVMPGMARLLHRPPYDFTRTYDYNRSRFAFGCYHCHRVN